MSKEAELKQQLLESDLGCIAKDEKIKQLTAQLAEAKQRITELEEFSHQTVCSYCGLVTDVGTSDVNTKPDYH